MATHLFHGRPKNEAVAVRTDAALVVALLMKGNHLINVEAGLRALGAPFVRLFEAFSPVEIDDAIAAEQDRDLVMQATKEKAPAPSTENTP